MHTLLHTHAQKETHKIHTHTHSLSLSLSHTHTPTKPAQVVYGSLPPETRKEQARIFNSFNGDRANLAHKHAEKGVEPRGAGREKEVDGGAGGEEWDREAVDEGDEELVGGEWDGGSVGRKERKKRLRQPGGGINVLVASDAVGMGLNLVLSPP